MTIPELGTLISSRTTKAGLLWEHLKSTPACQFCNHPNEGGKNLVQYQYKKYSTDDVNFTISNAIKNNWSLERIFDRFAIVCPKCQELFRSKCPVLFASFPVDDELSNIIEKDSRELGFTQVGWGGRNGVKTNITLGHLSGIYSWLKIIDEKTFLSMVKNVLDKYKLSKCDVWISTRYLGWYPLSNAETFNKFLTQWESNMKREAEIWDAEKKVFGINSMFRPK